ncbi:MAG: DUF86 domain-containing protein [Verrucomicrobiota bacterium]|jgi:uncharacterized protein with HEPN domain
MSRDNAYLRDILNAAQAIRRFVVGVSKEEFLADEEKYEAVNRKFEIIGEATKRLSPEARARFPGIPWQLVAGLRDVLILDYDEVNLNVVWDAAMDSLPPLISQLESYLAAHPLPESNGPPADV